MDRIGASGDSARFEGLPRNQKQKFQQGFDAKLELQRKLDLHKRIGKLRTSIVRQDVMFDHYASSREIREKPS